MKVTSRKEAMTAGLKHYFTGRPCRNGHFEKRAVICGTCLACARERASKKYALKPEHSIVASKRWRLKNPDYPDRNRKRINENSNRYRMKNKHIYAAHRAKNRSVKLRAMPAWFGELDEMVVVEAHDLAKQRELETGIKWEVDHIIPLAGRKVSGLHVASNIQVIPMTLNRKKSNRYAVQ
ncbi:hypothetical protein [Aeromonas veronii]|uniref:hypothetical protein n=1 Tax=Aeromonas veronii TaxID=654 RepID=UPI00226C7409|nr:hypothetical protein [Aeromonas veronii]MCX9103993.1 hypothetical protein [Aeromonas veronii]MCX9119644.1 hypothetical protein [Aeromonas veronii]